MMTAVENRESDMSLSNREESAKRKGANGKGGDDSDAKKLKALRSRIDDARLNPGDHHERRKILANDTVKHCGDCFSRGWAAAVEAIDGG